MHLVQPTPSRRRS